MRRPPSSHLFPSPTLVRPRAQDAPEGGNRFTGARFPAPLDQADPADRIRTIREFVLSVRADSSSSLLDDLLAPDRKSTRLNSSHANISYAVFCLKKNNTHT